MENRDGSVGFAQAEEREAIREMCEGIAKDGDRERLAGWGELAVKLVPQLLTALETAEAKLGGPLGEDIRDAVREHFLTSFDGKTMLKRRVMVTRVGIHVGEKLAIADIRLEVKL